MFRFTDQIQHNNKITSKILRRFFYYNHIKKILWNVLGVRQNSLLDIKTNCHIVLRPNCQDFLYDSVSTFVRSIN